MNRLPDPTDAAVDATVTADDEAAEAALRDELAETIGAMPEAHNVFDFTGEATTVVETDVELIAAALLPVVAHHVAEAEARGFERGKRDPWSGWIDGKKAGAVEERERIATAIEAYGGGGRPRITNWQTTAARIARGGTP